MQFIRGIQNIKNNHGDSIITIGNFDGIHLGHQKVLHYVCNLSQQCYLPITLILFEPQPAEFFQYNHSFKRLMNLQTKIKYISHFPIDYVLCIKFDQNFSNISPKDFITNILINKLHAKFIVIGDDFRFGSQRSGNIKTLEKMGKKNNYHVITIKSSYQDNIKISSTRIRNALSIDDINLTKKLLNRPFSIYGKVIHGKKIGRLLQYPTANIPININIALKNGVYAITMRKNLNKEHIGIANIGIKSNNTQKIRLLEVHLFNININLYGQKIEIFIHKKIRNEMYFQSLVKLKNQIFEDIKIAQKFFNKL